MIITMITVPYFAKLPILNIIGKKKKRNEEGRGKFNSVGSIANWFSLTKLISKTTDRHGYIVRYPLDYNYTRFNNCIGLINTIHR